MAPDMVGGGTGGPELERPPKRAERSTPGPEGGSWHVGCPSCDGGGGPGALRPARAAKAPMSKLPPEVVGGAGMGVRSRGCCPGR